MFECPQVGVSYIVYLTHATTQIWTTPKFGYNKILLYKYLTPHLEYLETAVKQATIAHIVTFPVQHAYCLLALFEC